MSIESPLLRLSVVLISGILGGELLGRLRLPKVTGWIGTGIALRAAAIPGLSAGHLIAFAPFTDFVLGYIAFTVGATLHVASLKNAGRRLLLLVIAEALVLPFFVVPTLYYLAKLPLGESMLLGAIAVAGAPGTTVLVVREARARGLLSRTLIAAVGLIDMVAVGAFAFVLTLVRGDVSGFGELHTGVFAVAREFGLALLIGGGCSAAALFLSPSVIGPAFLGPLMVTVILAAWGLSQAAHVSSILSCTIAGIAVSNLRHDTARSAEAYLHPFGGVLFAGFYTLAGMRLDFSLVPPILGIVLLYFAARLVGKSVSAYAAMSLARAPSQISKYLGLALLPHGGVAVGLIFLVQGDPALESMAESVVTIGLATLSLNQLVGPSATRLALSRAGEVAKDRPRLLDFLSEQRIVVGLEGDTKEEVIHTLADRLYATSDIELPKAEFLKRVFEREAEESTCLGKGFMIPHASLDTGTQVHGVLGLSKQGLELGAYDCRAVHAVVLLATPDDDRERHLEILAAFASAITRDANLREQLYAAPNPARAYNILHADDATALNYFLDEAILEATNRST